MFGPPFAGALFPKGIAGLRTSTASANRVTCDFLTDPTSSFNQAYKSVGESNEIPLQYYENNVVATMILARVMGEFGCHRLVYSSSATVYGIPPIVPIPETTKLDAKSPYGRSKVMSETILSDLCRCEFN